MKRIKELITVCLLVIMSMSTIPTYASIDNNGTGNGENSAPSTRGWIGRYWAFQENNGIRLYLADKHGYVVTNTVDLVNYKPESMESLGNSELKKWYNDYAGWTGKRNIPKKITYLGGGKTDPSYTIASLNNDPGIYFFPKTGENSNGTDIRETAEPQKMYTYGFFEGYFNDYVMNKFPTDKDGRPNTAHISSADGNYSYIDVDTNEIITVPHRIQGPVQRGGVGNETTGNIFMKQMMTPLGKDVNGETVYTAQYLLGLELPKVSPNGMKFTGGLEPMFEFYDKDLKEQLQKAMASGLNYNDSMYKVAKDNSLYVGAEPIGWFVNEVVNPTAKVGSNGNDLNAYWCTPTVVYGTVTHASAYTAKRMRDELKTSGMSASEVNSIVNSSGQSWQWSLAYTAYRLNKADTNLKMKPFEEFGIDPKLLGGDSSPYNLSLGFWETNWDTLGYGIMLFGLTPENSNVTHTSKSDGHGDITIAKFYEKNGSPEKYEVRREASRTIQITEEDNYKLVDWSTATTDKVPSSSQDVEDYDNYKSLSDGKYKGNLEEKIHIKEEDKENVLYVKLEAVDGIEDELTSSKITLNENEITHQFSLGNLVEGGILASLSREYMGIEDRDCTYSWETTSDTIVNADGTTTGGDTETEYCSNSLSKNYKDTGYGYGVTNRNHGYDKNMVYQTEESDTTVSGTADNMSGFTGNSFTPNMNFILNRSYSDKVTLYPNLNGGATGQLRDIGTLEEAYIPKGQRYNGLKETDTRQQWTGSFKTGFVWDSLSDPTGEWVEDNHGENGGDWTQTSTESGNGIGVLNNIYSQPDNFNILVYLGKTGVGNVVPSTEKTGFKIGDKAFKFFLYTRQDTSKKINFYPAVKMVYQTLGSENNGAYVTSENPSSLLNVSRVDTAVGRSSAKLPLSLESYQWSGHMRTLEMLSNKDINDKSSVLPGGAAYQLKTGNSSDNACTMWVGFRTYQTCLDDSNMIKLSNADGILSLSKAEENYNTFRDTAKNNLEHFQIEQWVAEGIIKDYDEFISANPVLVSGLGEESSFKGNTLDRSSKYYLKVDGTGANRADLDVLDSVEEKITWEIYSDTDGNVRVNKNGTEVASINKTQSISSLLGNAELKELDEKTKVITNFVNSIDRNKGSDRDGNTWYNEEFKSIKVLEAVCGFRVGFGGAETIRGSILDTKLTGHLSDRRDLYNYSAETLKEKTRTSMFLLSKKSTTSVAGKYPGYVGTLNGVDVVIPFIDRLMQSKLFYIPNATVTDLN